MPCPRPPGRRGGAPGAPLAQPPWDRLAAMASVRRYRWKCALAGTVGFRLRGWRIAPEPASLQFRACDGSGCVALLSLEACSACATAGALPRRFKLTTLAGRSGGKMLWALLGLCPLVLVAMAWISRPSCACSAAATACNCGGAGPAWPPGGHTWPDAVPPAWRCVAPLLLCWWPCPGVALLWAYWPWAAVPPPLTPCCCVRGSSRGHHRGVGLMFHYLGAGPAAAGRPAKTAITRIGGAKCPELLGLWSGGLALPPFMLPLPTARAYRRCEPAETVVRLGGAVALRGASVRLRRFEFESALEAGISLRPGVEEVAPAAVRQRLARG